MLLEFNDFLVVIFNTLLSLTTTQQQQKQQQQSANFWSGTILTARCKILDRELLFGKRCWKADYRDWVCIAFYRSECRILGTGWFISKHL